MIIKKKAQQKEEKIEKQAPTSIIKVKDIEIIPIISEKSKKLAEKQNTYVFKVIPANLNRTEIKQFIEKFFNVKVEKVRTVNYPKRIRGRTRIPSVRPAFKKAYVKLREGSKISLLE